jgi:hypothetical protein
MHAFPQAVIHKMPVIILTTLSLGIIAFLAYKSASNKPPSAGEATLLAILAGIFQILAGIVTPVKGVSPTILKGALMRLYRISRKAKAADEIAQVAFAHGVSANDRRLALGEISALLSFIQDELDDAMRDWVNFHAEATGTPVQSISALTVAEERDA